tara:strand:- start:236 stop:1162 length:927 start_codon:yes stop_codon:yes gene_type:complete
MATPTNHPLFGILESGANRRSTEKQAAIQNQFQAYEEQRTRDMFKPKYGREVEALRHEEAINPITEARAQEDLRHITAINPTREGQEAENLRHSMKLNPITESQQQEKLRHAKTFNPLLEARKNLENSQAQEDLFYSRKSHKLSLEDMAQKNEIQGRGDNVGKYYDPSMWREKNELKEQAIQTGIRDQQAKYGDADIKAKITDGALRNFDIDQQDKVGKGMIQELEAGAEASAMNVEHLQRYRKFQEQKDQLYQQGLDQIEERYKTDDFTDWDDDADDKYETIMKYINAYGVSNPMMQAQSMMQKLEK